MKPPTIGELKSRIGIRTWSEAVNVDFGSDPDYGPALLVWGKVTPVSGGMFFGSMQIDKAITHSIIIRTGPVVTMQHVIEANGYRYKVRRAEPMGGAEHYTLIEAEQIEKIAV